MQTAPTSPPVPINSFRRENSTANISPKAHLTGDLDAARNAWQLKKTSWLSLNLRQSFTDEAFMRNHIKAAGLHSPNRLEPATVSRLRTLLKRANFSGPEITASVGTNPRGFLALNPLLPLWAAVALVLESTGRFTRQAFELALAETL